MFAPPAHHLMCWKAWGQSLGITATPDCRCNQESAVIESILSIPDISRTECCCPSHLVGGNRDLFKSMCTAGVMRLVEGAAILLHHTCWCVCVMGHFRWTPMTGWGALERSYSVRSTLTSVVKLDHIRPFLLYGSLPVMSVGMINRSSTAIGPKRPLSVTTDFLEYLLWRSKLRKCKCHN